MVTPPVTGRGLRLERHIERAQRCTFETEAVRARAGRLGSETTQPVTPVTGPRAGSEARGEPARKVRAYGNLMMWRAVCRTTHMFIPSAAERPLQCRAILPLHTHNT
eukprot:scaffold73157_cov36-Phaeocystis_antarctica.AAC.1